MSLLYIQEPDEKNSLQNGGFRFSLTRAPGCSYFGQKISIPAIECKEFSVATPFLDYPVPTPKIAYYDFNLSFLVNANLVNYLELYEWINDLGRPDEFDGRSSILRPNNPLRDDPEDRTYSDGEVTLYNPNYTPVLKLWFEDMWPTHLGELSFETTDNDVKFVTCDVKFQYTLFKLELI